MSFSSCAAAMLVGHAILFASAGIVWIASPQGEFVKRQPGWEEYTDRMSILEVDFGDSPG